MSAILFLTVADDPETWAKLGFALDGRTVRLGSTAITLTGTVDDTARDSANRPADGTAGPRNGGGITGWNLADDSPLPESVDGLRTTATPGPFATPPPAPVHPNGIVSIDHLVVNTPDVARTVAAFEDLGWECRRTREGAAYGAQKMRQAFFWFGDVIVEVVGPVTPDPTTLDRPATFFGLALTATDIDVTAAFFGDLAKPPTDAVQQGRRITSISSRGGSTVAIAIMSPHPKAS